MPTLLRRRGLTSTSLLLPLPGRWRRRPPCSAFAAEFRGSAAESMAWTLGTKCARLARKAWRNPRRVRRPSANDLETRLRIPVAADRVGRGGAKQETRTTSCADGGDGSSRTAANVGDYANKHHPTQHNGRARHSGTDRRADASPFVQDLPRDSLISNTCDRLASTATS